MSEVKIPTCGRIVHYFPTEQVDGSLFNGFKKAPAIVMNAADNLVVALSVSTFDVDSPVVLRCMVPHISKVPSDSDGAPTLPCWDYPVIN